MKPETKEFLTKLAALMREYSANIEIEGDPYGGIVQMTLEVKNRQTFDEHYEQWVAENPDKQYPFGCDYYQYADWVDLKCKFDAESIKGILESE